MAKVAVYRFKRYEVSCDEYLTSRRYGTLDGIARVGGETVEHTAVEIDETLVGKRSRRTDRTRLRPQHLVRRIFQHQRP
jgi:hypothetical protein